MHTEPRDRRDPRPGAPFARPRIGALAPGALIAALAVAAWTAAPAASAQHAGHHKPAPAASANAEKELVDGEIRRIDPAKGTVLMRHGEMRSLNMGAMTMSFRFGDPKMAEGLKAGDKVRFTAEQKGDDLVITSIRKVN
jgi:Cu(I)/Ag(I) efflux system protein CusF